jgi:mannose/fructose/N-acetylgalactosamine-specific phosphotransferase system component IID
MAKNELSSENRLEKVLAGMMAGVLIASIVSILVIVGLAAGGQNQAIAIAVVFPLIGIPSAAALMLTLVVLRLLKSKRQ